MTTLAVWLHNIDPFAIQFPQGFLLDGIRWYGLAYLATFAFGFLFTRRVTLMGRTTLKPAEVMDFVITVAIGVIVGGRIGYVLFYKPNLLIEFSGAFPFWGMLQLNKGGMSSHGGMIGVGVAVWFYAWRSRRKSTPQIPVESHDWLHLFDFASFAATIGFFFGRIANFINAELVGRACAEDFPLAVKFPQELHDLSYEFAFKGGDAKPMLALTDAVENLGVSAQQWTEAIATKNIDFIDRTIHQLVTAIQDGGSRGSLIGDLVTPLLTAHHPSQLYAAFTEGVIVFTALAILWRKPQKAGVVTGLFGALYGVMRIINEFFRTPDAHIANQEFAVTGLTRGQLLSIVLVIASILLTIWCAKRNVPRQGGWAKSG